MFEFDKAEFDPFRIAVEIVDTERCDVSQALVELRDREKRLRRLEAGQRSVAAPRPLDGVRAHSGTHRIEDEVLFDCDLSAQRTAIGTASKST